MLTALTVQNLALAEDVTVTFGAGLNMITGETGAGKSMLMGALDLLVGERADKSVIRSGAAQCVVEGVFALADAEPVNAVLEELGLESLEDGALIVRRVIRPEGAGQTVVNDRPVTVQTLKRLGALLLDMHGAYDHQSLLHTDAQRTMLDAYGEHEGEQAAYTAAYGRLKAVEARIEQLQSLGGADVAEQLDLLSFKVKELEEADLSEQEAEEIEQEHAVFGHAQQIAELGGSVVDMLSEGETAALQAVGQSLRTLDALSRLLPEAAEWRAELDEAATRVNEVVTSVAARLDAIDADPGRLAWLDERLTVYQRMKRKYGPTVAGALATLESARARLADLQERDSRLGEAEAERQRVLAEVEAAGKALRAARQKTATRLAKAITRELRVLGFAHGRFGVDVLAQPQPAASGMDAIEFQFEPNPGEGMRPLRRIASSGEISRVMLATKAVLARQDRIPLLVFDEIDANIGGETGGAVGRKLAAVAAHHQILCITHLPQVAMYGAHHYAVRKTVEEGRTRTEMVALEAESRVEEIARMLGGKQMTASTLTHARDMLEKAAAG
jgi:DNA repair protein RecN (Recombination protein N)